MRGIPRVHSFFLPMLATKEWVRWMVTFFVLVSFVGIWWFGVHAVLKRLITVEYATSKQLKKQIRQTDSAESELVLLRAKTKELEERIASYHVPDFGIVWWNYTVYIIDLLQKCGLFLQGYSAIQTEPIIKNSLAKKSIKIDFSGDAKQVENFFSYLFESKHMIQLKQIVLNKVESRFLVSVDILLVSVDSTKNKKSLQPQIS